MSGPSPQKPMISCRELIDFLMDYLADELTPSQRDEFERHLAACPHCVAYLKSYEETVSIGKAAFSHPDNPAPDEVPEELVRAVLAARRKPE